MSEKLLRGCFLSVALIAFPPLASTVLAQQAEECRPRQSTIDRDTGIDTTRKTNAMSRTASPQSFATQAAVIGQAEIELGQLAAQKSQDKDVREYAQRMVNEASQASPMPAELKEFAATTLPTLQEHDELAHSLNADQKQ